MSEHPDQTSPMTVGPENFFDDKFDKPQPTDTALQSAAREAGWVLSELVDGIAFEKRQQVVNIINRLSAALSYSEKSQTVVVGEQTVQRLRSGLSVEFESGLTLLPSSDLETPT